MKRDKNSILLERFMRERLLSARDIAKLIGVSNSLVSGYLRGTKTITPERFDPINRVMRTWGWNGGRLG